MVLAETREFRLRVPSLAATACASCGFCVLMRLTIFPKLFRSSGKLLLLLIRPVAFPSTLLSAGLAATAAATTLLVESSPISLLLAIGVTFIPCIMGPV